MEGSSLMRKIKPPTAGPRPCACGCGETLPQTNKARVPLYVNRRHWNRSGARGYIRQPGSRVIRKRERDATTCPCADCRGRRGADRTALIARVAAEKGVEVSACLPLTEAAKFERLPREAAARRAALKAGSGRAWK